MPIVTRILCWNNTKEATRAVAIYGALLSFVYLFWYMHSLTIRLNKKSEDEYYDRLYKLWFTMMFVYSIYFINSCILMVGVEKGTRPLLINYLIFLIFYEMIDTAHIGYIIHIYGGNTEAIMQIAFYVYTFLMNIPIFIIILSEYQRTTELNKTAAVEDKRQALGNFDVEMDEATSCPDEDDWSPYGADLKTGGLPGYKKKYPSKKSKNEQIEGQENAVFPDEKELARTEMESAVSVKGPLVEDMTKQRETQTESVLVEPQKSEVPHATTEQQQQPTKSAKPSPPPRGASSLSASRRRRLPMTPPPRPPPPESSASQASTVSPPRPPTPESSLTEIGATKV
ncbi:uncharacterized protein [Ptychodera flava]|uniref:uncharacterized protein n=1 Tax=Ptychodera flava TaxID=63121 RepID=UPI00396A9245